MKKLLAVLLAGTMALSLAACGGGKTTAGTATKAAADTTAAGTENAAAEGKEDAGTELTGRLKAIKEAGVLKVATSPDYPPYEFEDITKDGQDKYVGADMELAKYIADKLGVKLQIEAMAFDACMAAIGQGRVDLTICGMVPKEERKTTMDFSDVYYNDGDQVIVIMKDSADQYKSLADFAGQPPYLWPARSASHLTKRENCPRATGARTSLKKKPALPLARAERKPLDQKQKPAPRHQRENLLKEELALMQSKPPQRYSFTAKINF